MWGDVGSRDLSGGKLMGLHEGKQDFPSDFLNESHLDPLLTEIRETA